MRSIEELLASIDDIMDRAKAVPFPRKSVSPRRL